MGVLLDDFGGGDDGAGDELCGAGGYGVDHGLGESVVVVVGVEGVLDSFVGGEEGA